MTVRCPLCLRVNTKKIEEIETEKIINAYLHLFQVDIRYELGKMETVKFFCCEDCKLKFFDPMITGSDKFYDSLQKFDWYYLEEKSEYSTTAKFIKHDDCILEIGCGSGAFARKISSKNYVGLELSQQAISKALSNGLTILNETVEFHSQKTRESMT